MSEIVLVQDDESIVDQLPPDVVDRLPEDIVTQLEDGSLDQIPEELVEQLPASIQDRIPDGLIDAASDNPTFAILLVVVGVLAVLGFIWGVTKSAHEGVAVLRRGGHRRVDLVLRPGLTVHETRVCRTCGWPR